MHNLAGNKSKNVHILGLNDLSFVNVSYINSKEESTNSLLKTTYIPLKIKNLDGNFLIEKEGLNSTNGKYLLELISKGTLQGKKDLKPDDFNNLKDQNKSKYEDWKHSVHKNNSTSKKK